MKRNIAVEIDDTDRNALARLVAGKAVKRLASRKEIAAFVMDAFEAVLASVRVDASRLSGSNVPKPERVAPGIPAPVRSAVSPRHPPLGCPGRLGGGRPIHGAAPGQKSAVRICQRLERSVYPSFEALAGDLKRGCMGGGFAVPEEGERMVRYEQAHAVLSRWLDALEYGR